MGGGPTPGPSGPPREFPLYQRGPPQEYLDHIDRMAEKRRLEEVRFFSSVFFFFFFWIKI
jgi:hypothetical protein